MFAHFLPSSTREIQDGAAIALLQCIQRRVVQVPVRESTTAIATAYAHYSPDSSTPVPGTIPILLLHGFDSSLLEFRRLLPLLAHRHETWAIDLLGSGFTEYIATLAVNPQTIRQHLLSVVKAWIGRPVILVGASLGGAVAIDFALHYPSWVISLVLMDSVGFSGSFPVGQFLPSPLIELGANWLYFRKHAALAAASALPILDVSLLDALRCSLLHQEMPGWKDAIASFTRSGGYANLSDRITQVTHPTLILWGKSDDVFGTADATRFEQAIAGSQLVWVEGAGHVPHFDQPQVVADHLLSFAQQIER
ncbi:MULTISPECIES: alpha/beta hydrolase [Cyanophyceae]|uniref:alpha/beta fold hydrolase n=1 Tax=Cyanophyceae TaxID=3028117 RepID=UPI0016884DF9|nr:MULTISPECIES: alpha/beta hydrolase [Cyanophyceae]MBD1916463.1 alpha/beta hydrolase [Phormidium sp. FACHB-77]MBD2032030.1 alpha/beta hydrolase [Phormidium sp. FACHB-322]MBD2052910.1 alpha/beta hydrolase [Leptolyngbya sp. FACHB-60]